MNASLFAGLGAVVVLGAWMLARRRSDVPCTIDLEATNDHFHAHVELQGIEVNEGDEVLVHGQLVRRFYRSGAGARSLTEVVATGIKKLEAPVEE